MECKEPVRVLQIIGIACNGGVESVILNYYRHIDKSKVQFDFVVHNNPSENFVREVKNGGGRLYEITPYMKNVFAFTYEIYKIIRNGRYEIVHSNMNSLSGFPLFAAWLADDTHILKNNDFTTEQGRAAYLTDILKNYSSYGNMRNDLEITTDSHILTLSTCMKRKPHNRFLVQAVLLNEDAL